MNTLTLSQWQFAITTIYHFFFVPLTLGLGVLVAVMETLYVRTNQEVYKRMTKFWGKLFLINFAMGVVTGIVQEFQFGMNWSIYSRYVGDVFGAPLAIEALLAFFLESTFLGLWIFGWDRLSKKVHLTAMWLVSIGSLLSALWILIANSFMQHPVGASFEGGRAVMTDFGQLLTNPYVWLQFPHVVFSGLTTGAFFVLGISAYHLIRKSDSDLFGRSFKLAAWVGVVSVLVVMLIGHSQAQQVVQLQPMKMSAAEALWEDEDNAGLSMLSFIDEDNQANTFDFRIPGLLSFLAYGRFGESVQGINTLEAQFEAQYSREFGENTSYIPSVTILYWTFRAMVGAGLLMFLAGLVVVFFILRKRATPKFILKLLPFAILLPYLANTTGWILTEMGRQPWIVYGKLLTSQAVSPSVEPGEVMITLIAFLVIYGVLMAADIYLLAKFAKAGEKTVAETVVEE